MNEEYKKIIEDIILKFKSSKNGIIQLAEFTKFFESSKLNLAIARIIIDDLNLVDRVSKTTYRLTNKGWSFNSFADLEKLDNVKSEREKLELELAKSNLEANILNREIADRNARNEKNNLIATWINVGIGLINIILFVIQMLKGK